MLQFVLSLFPTLLTINTAGLKRICKDSGGNKENVRGTINTITERTRRRNTLRTRTHSHVSLCNLDTDTFSVVAVK